MRGGRCLELGERAAHVIQRDIGVGGELSGALELVERSHRLRDRSGELDQMARDARVCLESIQSTRERLACGA